MELSLTQYLVCLGSYNHQKEKHNFTRAEMGEPFDLEM